MTTTGSCHSAASLRPGAEITILYVNGEGHTSTRRVDVERTYRSRAGVGYFEAFCHLRGESRCFREDRVLAVVEVHTAGSSNQAPPATDYAAERRTRAARGPASRDVPPAPQVRKTHGTPINTREYGSRPQTGRPSRLADTRIPSPRRRKPRVLGKLATIAILAVLGAWVYGELEMPSSPILVSRSAATQRAAASVPSPQPAPEPNLPRSYTITYRGSAIAVTENRSGVAATVTGMETTYDSVHAARIAINSARFSSRTGIRTRTVIDLYATADQNRDGDIDWPEIERFQTRLMRSYDYKANDSALRPDEFIAQRGGDCEDFALVTAGLLRFWGVPVAIASVQSAAGNHAIALVETSRIPAGYTYLKVTDKARGEIRYVPIDYQTVGGFSSAVARGYTITDIWIPEETYGWNI